MHTLLRLLAVSSLCAIAPAQRHLHADLAELVTAKLARDQIPGLSCAAFVGDELVFARGFGFSDVENEVAATDGTVYRLASISKPVAAVLAMQLAEQGALDLDRDVAELVPEWPAGKRWPVTTRQLLGHLGGVRHYQGEGESTRRYRSQRSALPRFAADPLLHEPGSRFRYSTYGFNLVAAVVEALRGRAFPEVLAKRVSAVAAAASLQDDDLRRIIPHRAQGYVRRSGELRNSGLMDSSYKLGGGGLCSSAPDLARFAQALIGGKLVSQQSLAQMWTPQRTVDGAATGYGLGFSIGKLDGELLVGHSGAQSRVSTILQMLPKQGVGVVVMCNLEGVKLGGLAAKLLRRLREEATR